MKSPTTSISKVLTDPVARTRGPTSRGGRAGLLAALVLPAAAHALPQQGTALATSDDAYVYETRSGPNRV